MNIQLVLRIYLPEIIQNQNVGLQRLDISDIQSPGGISCSGVEDSQQSDAANLREDDRTRYGENGIVNNKVPVVMQGQQTQQVQQVQQVTQSDSRTSQLEMELQQWITRYRELEAMHAQDGNQINLIRQYQERCEVLSQENMRLSSMVQEKMGECEKWKISYQEVELTVRNLQEQLNFRSQELTELKSILDQSSLGSKSQFQEFQNQLALYHQEIENWRYRYEQAESEKIRVAGEVKQIETQRYQWEMEMQRVRSQLENRMREVEQLRSSLHGLEQQLIESNEKAYNYEEKLIMLTQEIETSNTVLQQKNEQIKRSAQENERSSYTTKKSYTEQLEQVQQRLKQAEYALEEKSRKVRSLEAQAEQQRLLEGQLVAFEEKMGLLSAEIERLHYTVKQKDQEIEALEKDARGRRQLEEKVVLLGGEVQRLGEVQRALMAENEQLRNGHFHEQEDVRRKYQRLENEYQLKIDQQRKDNERLNQLVSQSQQERARDEQKVVLLSQEIERLSQIIKNQNLQIDKLNYKSAQSVNSTPLHLLDPGLFQARPAPERDRATQPAQPQLQRADRDAQAEEQQARTRPPGTRPPPGQEHRPQPGNRETPADHRRPHPRTRTLPPQIRRPLRHRLQAPGVPHAPRHVQGRNRKSPQVPRRQRQANQRSQKVLHRPLQEVTTNYFRIYNMKSEIHLNHLYFNGFQHKLNPQPQKKQDYGRQPKINNQNNWYSLMPKRTSENSFHSHSQEIGERLKTNSFQTHNRSFVIKKRQGTLKFPVQIYQRVDMLQIQKLLDQQKHKMVLPYQKEKRSSSEKPVSIRRKWKQKENSRKVFHTDQDFGPWDS